MFSSLLLLLELELESSLCVLSELLELLSLEPVGRDSDDVLVLVDKEEMKDGLDLKEIDGEWEEEG